MRHGYCELSSRIVVDSCGKIEGKYVHEGGSRHGLEENLTGQEGKVVWLWEASSDGQTSVIYL